MHYKKFPKAKYLLPAIATGGPKGFAIWAGEQAVSQETWWSMFPWGWMSLIGLAWLIGTVYADIWNPDSQFRDWMRGKWRLFDADNPIPASVIIDEASWFEVRVPLNFVRRVHIKSARLRISYLDANLNTATVELETPASIREKGDK